MCKVKRVLRDISKEAQASNDNEAIVAVDFAISLIDAAEERRRVVYINKRGGKQHV